MIFQLILFFQEVAVSQPPQVNGWLALAGLVVTGILVHNAPAIGVLANNRGDRIALEAKNKAKEEELAAKKLQIEELIKSNKELQEALRQNTKSRDEERKALKQENKRMIAELQTEHKDYIKKLKAKIDQQNLNNEKLNMKYQAMQDSYQRVTSMVDAFMIAKKDNPSILEVMKYMSDTMTKKEENGE